MKNTKLKFFLLFFVPVLLFAGSKEGRYKKIKVIHHEYALDKHQNVIINNTYGNIQILNWDKNTVDIKVRISVDGDNEEAVSKRLNSIDVDLSENSYDIQATTQIGSVRTSWNFFSWIFGSSDDTHFKISYEIKMPARLNLDVESTYGNLYLDKLQGELNLHLTYGKFEIGELLHSNNNISGSYLSKSSIDFMKEGSIYCHYSKINIETAYELNLNCNYTNIHIGQVRRLKFDNNGGNLKVEDVKEVTGSGNYQNRYFGHVNTVDFQGNYGSISIDNIMNDFEKINLDCNYTNIKIINSNQVPYRLKIRQNYGCFKPNDIEIYKEIIHNGNKIIEGFYGDKNARSIINIEENYGCIKIYN